MPHFLINKQEVNNNYIELSDNENLFHITKVLRAKVNEIIKFIDDEQFVYECKIIEISKNFLKAQILSKVKSTRNLKNNLCLIQSILASDAQNLLIANATQAGVKKIYPVISKNCSVKFDTVKTKISKWQKIAYENFKQCERADMVEIQEIISLENALKKFEHENILIFGEKHENISMNDAVKNVDKTKEIALIIGPEGGFSENEFECFIKNQYKIVSLGKMIYKAPNAVVAAISNVVSRLENNV